MTLAQGSVSVVIPAYNQSAYLVEAIDSALAQTVPALEVIIVDDGSTDDTPRVAAAYGNRIRYIRQANRGLASSRNTGIEAADGTFVGLLDADDSWRREYLATMLELANRHPSASVYYCGIDYIDAMGGSLPQDGAAQIPPPTDMYRKIVRGNFLIPSTVLMRRAAVLAAGGFDVTFRRLQDWELWIRLLRAGHTIIGSPHRLVRYRIHPESLSTDPSGGEQAARCLVEKHFGADDGRWQDWSEDKRWAYSALHRYSALLTALMRRGDSEACVVHLRRALAIDPSNARDPELFYQLALGDQAPGFRGTRVGLDLEARLTQACSIVERLFERDPSVPDLSRLRRPVIGTAHFAFGLLAFHQNRLKVARRHLQRAAALRPELLASDRYWGTYLRSCMSRRLLSCLRSVRRTSLRSGSPSLAAKAVKSARR